MEVTAWLLSEMLDDKTCFPKNTQIKIDKGNVDIQNIIVGDKVLTRRGYKKVLAISERIHVGEMIVLKSSFGELRCTGDHPIWAINKGWVEAKDVCLGDRIFDVGKNKIFGRLCIFIERLRDAKNRYAIFIKKNILSFVARWVSMPICSINLYRYAFAGDIEINRVPSDFTLLNKLNVNRLKNVFYEGFKRGFANKLTITRDTTKTPFSFFAGDYSKFVATIQTDNFGGWSSACFRTVFAIFVASVEYLATAVTCPVKRFGSTAFQRAVCISVRIRNRNIENLVASWTNFLDSIASTFHGTVGISVSHSGQHLKRLAASFTNFLNSFLALYFVHTFPRTKVLRFLVWLKKLTTEFAVAFRFHRVNYIQKTPVCQELVYNLQIEDDPVFYANGILVHNCEVCAARDGVLLPADDPQWNGPLGELAHDNCRAFWVPVFDIGTMDFTPAASIPALIQRGSTIQIPETWDEYPSPAEGLRRMQQGIITLDEEMELLQPYELFASYLELLN